MAERSSTASGRTSSTGARHTPTYLILAFTAVAAVIAGAGESGAGLAVLVIGLLTATTADFLRWRDEEIASGGLTFGRSYGAAEPSAPPRALPPPSPSLELSFDGPAGAEALDADAPAGRSKRRSRVSLAPSDADEA